MRKRIYRHLTDLLSVMTDHAGEPLVKHIDLWNQNVQFASIDTPFNLPAVFIEFGDIHYDTVSTGIQTAEVSVILHIVTKAQPLQAGWERHTAFFELVDAIHNGMTRMRATDIGSFQRSYSKTNHNHEELLESIEGYTTFIEDRSAL